MHCEEELFGLLSSFTLSYIDGGNVRGDMSTCGDGKFDWIGVVGKDTTRLSNEVEGGEAEDILRGTKSSKETSVSDNA